AGAHRCRARNGIAARRAAPAGGVRARVATHLGGVHMASQGWLKFVLRRALPALAVLALLLASLKLAEDAAGGGGAAQYYRWILAAAAVSLALLAVAIAQRLWRLRIELERGA